MLIRITKTENIQEIYVPYTYTSVTSNKEKMNRILQILTLALLISSCSNEKELELEGIWYGAYIISDDRKTPLSETTLLEFKSDQLYTVKIRDFALGRLDDVKIDTAQFQFINSQLKYKSLASSIELSQDSMILDFENQTIVFKRIPDNLRNVEIGTTCFKGSYLVKSKFYQDSINFINDSYLLYTGEYDQYAPGKSWQIIHYSDFKFLNIHSVQQPVTIIKSCNSNSIDLVYPSLETINIKLTPTISQIDKKQLIGKWIEVESSHLLPPPLPNLTEADLLLAVSIRSDSIKIKEYGQTKTHHWDLTEDGKRIYFLDSLDRLSAEQSSWKLLALSDSSMTMKTIRNSGRITENIVRFKKINSR